MKQNCLPGISCSLSAVILTALFGFVLTACSDTQDSSNSVASETSEQGEVLALVNDEPIYVDELESMMRRTFSDADLMLANESVHDKVLESLITSRAIKQKALQTLSPDELKEIQAQVRSYAEELYVQAYLKAHADPQPVTTEMVKEYYDSHPSEFGGMDIRHFELLKTQAKPNEAKRDLLLSNIEAIKKTTNWQENQIDWKQRYDLVLLKGEVKEGLFDPAIESQLSQLKEGEVSGVMFIREVPHIIRITGTRTTPPKPLAEVSAEIRKKLAPLQLRNAVKDVSVAVTRDAKIEIIGQKETTQ